MQECVNCGRWDRPLRCRGLCEACHGDPVIRQAYPRVRHYQMGRVEQDFYGIPSADPAGPVRALPGTAAKIDALTARASQRLCLWHPGPATDSQAGSKAAQDSGRVLSSQALGRNLGQHQ